MPSRLTDQQCKAAKPRAKGYKLFTGDSGLFLYVTPAGGKYWRLQYRVAGKQQTASLGEYPAVGLKDAREKAVLFKPTSGRAVQSKSFSQCVREYWSGRHDLSAGYKWNATRALSMHVEPYLGDKLACDITRDDLMSVFNRMDAKGLFSYVRKTRRWTSNVLDWAVEQGLATSNAAMQINPEKAFGRRAVEHHAAIMPSALKPFLDRLALEPPLQSVLALKLLMLTWVRTDELRSARWSEFDGELWRIPAARMKRRLDHLVPLSRQAQEILKVLKARSGSEFVFPNERRRDRPMSENAVLYLIGRMGWGGKVTGHGFRSTGSTWANERGYNPDAVERQLAHVPREAIRAIYNHAEWLPERGRMLQDYADWMDSLRTR